jgi:tRNA modification GTPase
MTSASTDTIDTIYALSSAPGRAGVAVVRVSGPKALQSLERLTGNVNPRPPRKSFVATLTDPASGTPIDSAMVIPFHAPASFTGENVVEYHCHGSAAVLDSLFEALAAMDGIRMADHGEFTRRAFENAKLDLTEAEAIADLIDAETKAQKDQALAQMGGALSTLYAGWAQQITRILAYVEAVIDFPDEDVPDDEIDNMRPSIESLINELEAHLNDNRQGERLRSGIKIAVIGAPNAGKSSLVNCLAQRDIAIVSDIAGTTRDIIEVPLNLGGYPVLIGDTAGLRPEALDTKDEQHKIESEGIRRALAYAKEADIRLLVFDAGDGEPHAGTLKLKDEKSVIVINKSDQHSAPAYTLPGAFPISAQTGENIQKMLDEILTYIKTQIFVSRETPSLTRKRHRENLLKTVKSLKFSLDQAEPEMMAQEIRFALSALGRITGRVNVDDLLDVIFRDFCIGK